MGVISHSQISLCNINDGISVTNTTVTYAISESGIIPPSIDIANEDGLVLVDENGRYLTTLTDWNSEIPECPEGWYLWSKTVIQYSDGTSACIYSVSRQGEKGDTGVSVALVYLYQRAASAPSAPASNTTYSFATGELAGTLGNWTQDIPSGDNPIWVVFATAISNSGTDVIGADEWSTPVQLVRNGYNTAIVRLYKRSASIPAKPSGSTTYTFSTGVLNPVPSGWSTSIPATNANGEPCYTVSASAISHGDTYTIQSSNWSDPVKIIEDGTSVAVIHLFKRGTTAPSVPSSSTTYTFDTGVLSGTLDSWSQTIPSTGTDPVWTTFATASSNGETDTILATEWSTPVVFVKDGYNKATISLYQRSVSVPTKPSTTTTYTFSTNSLSTTPTGWSTTIPAPNNNPCYVTMATAVSRSDTYDIAGSSWTTPVIYTNEAKQVEQQWCVSNSATSIGSSPTWLDQQPTIDSTASPAQYLWMRWKTTKDDGSIIYSDAIYQSGITQAMFKVDDTSKKITSKVWSSDIDSKIQAYDGTTIATIRDDVSAVEQDVSGISSTVSSHTTSIDGLGTRMSAAETNITQSANDITMMATFNGQHSSFTLTNDMISAMTNQFVVKDSSGTSTIISGGRIQANSIALGDLSSAAQAAIGNGATTATNYIEADENGIKVHNAGDLTDYLKINSSSIEIFRNSTSVASLADATFRVGTTSGKNIYIDSNYVNVRNGETILAKYGADVQIGGTGSNTRNIYINSTGTNPLPGVHIRNDTTDRAFFGDSIYLYNTDGTAAVSITTSGASFTGDITASGGFIGGFTIDSDSVYSGTKGNSNSDGDITLTNSTFQRTIDEALRSDLKFAIGSKFGVAEDGTVYTNGAYITNINADNITAGTISANKIYGGTLDCSSMTVSNLTVINSMLASGISATKITTGDLDCSLLTVKNLYVTDSMISGKISASHINTSSITIGQSQVTNLTSDLSSISTTASNAATAASNASTAASNASTAASNAAKTATNYLTTISGKTGISIHNASDTSNYALFNSDGMQVYKSGNEVASFGSTITLGKNSSGNSYTIIDNYGITLKTYGDSGKGQLYKVTDIMTISYNFQNGGSQSIHFDNSDGLTITDARHLKARTYISIDDGTIYAGSANITTSGTVLAGYLKSTSSIASDTHDSSNEAQVHAYGKAGKIYLYSQNSSSGARGIYTTSASNASKTVLGVDASNNAYFYGTLGTGSDLRMKNVIDDYNWNVDKFISSLKPIAYRWKDNKDDTNIHYGFGAQDVQKLTKSLNLGDVGVYDIRCRHTKDSHEERYTGDNFDKDDLIWTLSYDEFIAPMILEIQRLMKRVDELEKK